MFKQVVCILCYFSHITAHKFVEIHMGTLLVCIIYFYHYIFNMKILRHSLYQNLHPQALKTTI
jgi:hypothetical protein